METVASAYRSVQIFNLDKRFSFFKEDTQQSWSGRKLKSDPKTLRQIFNHSMILIEADAPTGMQKRPEAANLVALTESRRLSQLALQAVQKNDRRRKRETSLSIYHHYLSWLSARTKFRKRYDNRPVIFNLSRRR